MYKVGKLVEKNLHKAFLLISESAAQKNPEAIYNLGYMYYFGEGVEKDLEKAYRLFHESAFKRKNYESMYYVASILLDTDCGIENNYNKGIDYMLRSAQAGVVKAQLALAIFYWKGFYFKKDIKTALYWALEAANRGSSEAANLLSELLAIMEE
jgi:TPR repeat protein